MKLNYRLPYIAGCDGVPGQPDLKELGGFMNELVPIALKLNQTEHELAEESIRDGQCHLCYGNMQGFRISIHFIPEEAKEFKIRYAVNANNKFSWLLENGEDSTPEDALHRVWPGGIRIDDKITAISGYHPKIDQALSIINHCYIYGTNGMLTWAKHFDNKYVQMILDRDRFSSIDNYLQRSFKRAHEQLFGVKEGES